jgi:hypothetical protein
MIDGRTGAFGSMGIGKANRNNQRKPAPVPLCSMYGTSHMERPWIEPGPPKSEDDI